MKEKLIEDYDLELFTPPCVPGAERWSGVARLRVDIREALPYLNATLSGSVYSRGAKALTWKNGGRSSAFHADRIMASNLEDRAEAEEVIRGLIETVNRTWQKRAEIEPDFDPHQRPTPMAIFQLLPGTNCRQCGQPTCFNFALKVAAGQQKPEDCPPLLQPELAGQLAQLRAIAVDAPASG